MRIVFVSNFYPPAYLGGYEIGCREIADALSQRGHEVQVLTSSYKEAEVPAEPNVHRVLWHALGTYPVGPRPLDPATIVRGQWFCPLNFARARRWLSRLRPDVVYYWCVEHISVATALAGRTLNLPRAFYVFDRWPADVFERYTESPSGVKRLAKRGLLAPVLGATAFSNVLFASRFLQDLTAGQGFMPDNSRVLPHGLRLEQWPPPPPRPAPGEPWRLLFVGNVYPHKGVHTILGALGLIEAQHRVTLDIVGDGPPAYRRKLEGMAEGLGNARVQFLGRLPREQLREVYQSHDLLLFPSICEEGMGLVVLEAMVSGLPVIISRTGGTVETMEGSPAPNVFEKEDAAGLARLMVGVLSDSAAWRGLREWGIERVRSAFSFERTVTETEQFLSDIAG